jgi:hypothetical protein
MKIKIIIFILAIIIFAPFLLWIKDIQNDRQETVTTIDKTPLYSKWKCGFNCGNNEIIDIIPSGKNIPVRRIRYGKDFMGIKVIYNNRTGWLIYSEKYLKIIKG